MNPNMPNNPQQPATPPAPAPPTPGMPPQPQQNPQQPVQQQTSSQPMMPPQPQYGASSNNTKSGSKTGIIVAVVSIIALILLSVGGYFLYVTMFSDSAKAKKASNGFMAAITAENIPKALEYIDQPEEDEKKFLESMAKSVKGSFTLDESKLEDGKGYFLYNLEGANNKYARTILDKESGSWKVNNFVSGENPLKLIPGGEATEDKEETAPSPQSADNSSLACLAQADYRWINFNKQADTVEYDESYDPSKNTFNKTVNMFFKPDSTTEDSLPTLYEDIAEFAKKNVDKQWKLVLEGSVYGTDSALASSKKLANDRSKQVTAQLVQRGVPADRIVIAEPKDYTNEPQTSQIVEIYRRVQIVVDPTCNGGSGR